MYLLNSFLISEYLNDEDGTLAIQPKTEISKYLEHTFYYFRLGSEGELNGKPFKLSVKENFLKLGPGDFANIKSYESFTLSAKILGIIGSCRNMTEDGLQLLYSPFIDPKYNGDLKFGVKNLNNKEIILEYKVSKIGKVSFFDISDTYPLKIREEWLRAKNQI